MKKSKKNTSKKTVTGVVLASLFALSTSISTYATAVTGSDVAATGSIKPFINVIDQRTPADLSVTFTNDDVIAAGKVAESTAQNAEQYILAAQYQVCVLSNAMETESSKAGLLMKVTKSTASSGIYYDTSNTNSQSQLALYSTASAGGANKIRYILHVTPGGKTKLATTFGAGSQDSVGFNQYDAASFVIGASVGNGASASVYLNAPNATAATSSATSLENLALDSWGTVNHFAMNSNLGSSTSSAQEKVSDANGSITGLASSEARHLDNCDADQNPGPTDTAADDTGIITIKIYVNANDMAASVAGSYTTEYKLSFADVDDISSGVDDTQ
jgi:hypothetical protein